jgi:hypothetical protein
VIFSNVSPLDFEGAVAKARHTLAVHQKLFDESLIAGIEEKIAIHQRNLERSFESLRKAEESLINVQKARGNLVSKEGVNRELAQLFDAIVSMRKNMARDIMAEVHRQCPRRLARIFSLIQNFLEPAVEKVRRNEERRVYQKMGNLGSAEAVTEALDLVLERQ